jgi:serine/threonine protein kinase
MHRDVKPSNILLNRQGDVKLCDFGVSKKIMESLAKTRNAGTEPYLGVSR